MDHYVMDYEALSNCFVGVFEHYKKDEVKVFIIGKLQNDLKKFISFLENNIANKEWHISFNGLDFDAQITQFILDNRHKLFKMDGEEIAKIIYREAQDIIARRNRREFPRYKHSELSIRQLDLFKLNHWDNPAKSSSLKWIQCSMDWPNVQDMPIHHTATITKAEELQEIVKYCRNDVSSTKEIMNRNKKEIALRGKLSKTYGIDLYSASEAKIAKELFLHFLSKKTGIPKYELRQLRTFRTSIEVNDIILPYTEFSTKVFKNLLQKFRQLVINPNFTKDAFKYQVDYRGVKTTLGLGGAHGARRGIFESDEDMVIMTSDVKSYYPNLSIRNKWAPAHLPKDAFCELYEWFYNERVLIPKSDSRNYVYKLILNITFGLSNDKHSFLYDPEFAMRITINGQLSVMMLYEILVENIPGAIPLMQNTDGLEIIIPRKYKDKYLKLCTEWEYLTNLTLEHDEYQKIVVPDVNNYIGIFKDVELSKEDWLNAQKESPENLFTHRNGKYYMANTKSKGRFEFLNRQLHKNKSFTIIPKTLYHFFVHGIKPEDYIEKNNNIYDYCGQTKARGDWEFKEFLIENGNAVYKPIQKTLRYYVSNRGSKILKYNTYDGRKINIEAGQWLQTVFNLYVDKPFNQYDINKRFYLDRIYKEIKVLQPDLFFTQSKLNF